MAVVVLCLRGAPRMPAQSQTETSPTAHASPLIPRTADEREQRFRAQHRFELTVQVADAAGRPASNLHAADFTVLDNEQARIVTSFQSAASDSSGSTATILLVLDTVNSSTRQLQSFARTIEQVLRAEDSTLAYPVSIGVLYGSSIDVDAPTSDRSILLGNLKVRAARLRSTGCVESEQQLEAPRVPWLVGIGTVHGLSPDALDCMNQRFISSVTALTMFASEHADGTGPLLVLWFGPGWPLLTNREFRADSQDLARNFFTQLVGISTALREAHITIDALASPDNSPEPEQRDTRDVAFFAGVSDENEARAGNLGLHALAHQTGGRILSSVWKLGDQIHTCMADADSYYRLSFDFPPAANYGEFHALAVKVDRPGFTVRTTPFYYAEQ
ncbi:MAG: VWA domain-containing protein [Terracidiphilus sp.]